jgi:hypothetical protein
MQTPESAAKDKAAIESTRASLQKVGKKDL